MQRAARACVRHGSTVSLTIPHPATTYLLSTSRSRSTATTSTSNKRVIRGGSISNTSSGKPSRLTAGSGATGSGNRSKFQAKGYQGRQEQTYQNDNKKAVKRDEVLAPPPALTKPEGPFPWYFTCRHTYEPALIEELLRSVPDNDARMIETSNPSPGLVRVVPQKNKPNLQELLKSLDPIYALQSIPNCVVVTAPSIKQLALQSLQALEIFLESESESETSQLLRQAPRGSLAVHALVPGMFKGQTDPVLLRRAEKVAEEAAAILKKGFKCARRKAAPNNEEGDNNNPLLEFQNDRWILQLLLFSPDVVAASLTKCATPFSNTDGDDDVTWPNWR
jgi:hypothetical protein